MNLKTLQDKHDAFYVADLGDIIRKYENWITHLPRIEPFYGMQFENVTSTHFTFYFTLWQGGMLVLLD